VSGQWLRSKLDAMHATLFDRARQFREQNTRRAGSYDEMKKLLVEQGGFVRCWFEPSRENEAKIKDETKATVRCIPLDQPGGGGTCIFSGKPTSTEVLFAVAY
jgi:prolyl-tRNA synthetase